MRVVKTTRFLASQPGKAIFNSSWRRALVVISALTVASNTIRTHSDSVEGGPVFSVNYFGRSTTIILAALSPG
jgi:hypothetical protein